MNAYHWRSNKTNRLTSPEWFFASIAACSKLFVVTIGAENVFIFRSKGLVDQGLQALKTLETKLMPVAVLVRQILEWQKENGTLERWLINLDMSGREKVSYICWIITHGNNVINTRTKQIIHLHVVFIHLICYVHQYLNLPVNRTLVAVFNIQPGTI